MKTIRLNEKLFKVSTYARRNDTRIVIKLLEMSFVSMQRAFPPNNENDYNLGTGVYSR